MTVHMKREIDKLKQMLLSLCEVVENSLRQAVKSIKERDANLAKTVIEMDVEIKHMELIWKRSVKKFWHHICLLRLIYALLLPP